MQHEIKHSGNREWHAASTCLNGNLTQVHVLREKNSGNDVGQTVTKSAREKGAWRVKRMSGNCTGLLERVYKCGFLFSQCFRRVFFPLLRFFCVLKTHTHTHTRYIRYINNTQDPNCARTYTHTHTHTHTQTHARVCVP